MSKSNPETIDRKLASIKERVIFIVGPTAVGKTEIAVELAKKINAEIISCDSMQVYKGMDILSSMPSLALRKEARHHLIRFIDPSQEYDVSKYRSLALQTIKKIRRKGKLSLFVGGSGLYMSILMKGLFTDKVQNRTVRNKLYRLVSNKGSLYLHRRLREVDPAAAARIHPHDTRRIVRALEVYEANGRPISELQKNRRGLLHEYVIKVFCLDMARDKLYNRIEQRVETMFKQGLVSEVRKLLKKRLSKTASRAIGIPEIKGYLNGDYDLTQARRLIQRNSRRLAKRQLSWFRQDKTIKWVCVSPGEKSQEVARKIQKELSS